MHELGLALALVFVCEGLFYTIAPDRARQVMREIGDMPPEVLRTAGMILALIGSFLLIMLRR